MNASLVATSTPRALRFVPDLLSEHPLVCVLKIKDITKLAWYWVHVYVRAHSAGSDLFSFILTRAYLITWIYQYQ